VINGQEQIAGHARLRNVAHGAQPQAEPGQLRLLRGSQEDDPCLRVGGQEMPGGLDAIHHRHRDVEHDQIRAQRRGQLHCRAAVVSHSNDLQRIAEHPGDLIAHALMIVGYQHTPRHGGPPISSRDLPLLLIIDLRPADIYCQNVQVGTVSYAETM